MCQNGGKKFCRISHNFRASINIFRKSNGLNIFSVIFMLLLDQINKIILTVLKIIISGKICKPLKIENEKIAFSWNLSYWFEIKSLSETEMTQQ